MISDRGSKDRKEEYLQLSLRRRIVRRKRLLVQLSDDPGGGYFSQLCAVVKRDQRLLGVTAESAESVWITYCGANADAVGPIVDPASERACDAMLQRNGSCKIEACGLSAPHCVVSCYGET